MSVQVTIRREKYPVGVVRWVVRSADHDEACYGWSSTWAGAWRLACQVVGYKIPKAAKP